MQNEFAKYLKCQAESAFGFPEQDVIHFINNNGLSKEEARDFMLFLTFVNQTEDTDDDNMGVILNATVLTALVTRLNKSATENEELPNTVRPKVLYSSRSVDKPSISLSDTIPSLPRINSIGFRHTSARHNDVKYYPNIICLICKEWVCSRSRVFVFFRGDDPSRLSMAVHLRVGGLRSCIKLNLLDWNTDRIKRLHIGAHLDYRKYKCSSCAFSHSKEIFVAAHIRRYHDGGGFVIQHCDSFTEERIECICNESIAMTKDVLSGSYDENSYADYSRIITLRSRIRNKERSTRTKILSAVRDARNRQ
ncbi:unnamed protein product [Angiostrongylus costaricensis]|uniref:C2H2-type domain-containing protein n=1 Tax=Angiostrongylus costaricensis TaxID=334426 RepID=A0A0R3PAV7_ANGCS|nr:unnamed protein product [Angiostrongylus costaricensis]